MEDLLADGPVLDPRSIVLLVLGLVARVHGRARGAAGPGVHGRAVRPLHPHAAAGPQPDRAARRPHRPPAQHDGAGAGRALAGDHHPRQRDGDGRRRGLLPGAGRGQGGLRGHQPRQRHPQPDHDQHPHGHGLDGPGRAALPARRDQRPAAAGRRRGDLALGRQGDPDRDQGHHAAAGSRRCRWPGR